MLVVTPHIAIPLEELRFTFARSSGPGGQNVNKVSTKAQLRWAAASTPSLPEPIRARLLQNQRRRLTAEGDLLIVSQRFRDAPRNRDDCLEKLRRMLLEAAASPRIRRRTRPTRASVRRRLNLKQKQARKKQHRRAAGDE